MRIFKNILPALCGLISAFIVYALTFGMVAVSSAPPKTISIPDMNLQTRIEPVGINEKKAMADPQNATNVAWYKYGATPGEKGNAVLAGHYDDEDGPAIFYKLSELKAGDEIIITNEKGLKDVFMVKYSYKYPTDNFPMPLVFGDDNDQNLNLITCAGTFDEETQDYSHRLVVFAEKTSTITAGSLLSGR